MNDFAPAALAPASDAARSFLDQFEAPGRHPGPEASAAAALFRRHGLPGMRDEAFHYTPLRTIADTAFAPGTPGGADLAGRLPALDGPRIVFANGRFDAALSRLPTSITVRTGAPSFGALARPASEKLVALNTMLAEDGVAIDVPAGVDGGAVLLAALGSGTATGDPAAWHPRHAIRLGAGATLTLVETTSGTGRYLHNAVFEVTVGPGARLVHPRLQDESADAFHLATIYADIDQDATYDSFTLALGGRLARAEVHARLAGPRARAVLNAAQLLAGIQHGDITTVVRHDAPNTASRQTVKHVLAGRARGVFQGRIEVARVAQKTDGYQMNQALLLSPHAEIDAKPELEIFADDVKCSHGATVGELDATQLFYLRSRGVPADQARAILVRAFLDEALEAVTHEPARAAMEACVGAWWERQAT